LQEGKKILSTLLKVVVGLASFAIIYYRLKNDFTPDKITLLSNAAFSTNGIFCFTFCFILIPVNWGLESLKWKLITEPIQNINLKTASQSVYSGVCLGNLAPGRATEFVAKILFFEPENRPKITVLHFINGMFQLSVTIITGLIAIAFWFNQAGNYSWLLYLTSSIGILILIALTWCIYKVEFLLKYISKKLNAENEPQMFSYRFTLQLVIQLFIFSVLRFVVFFTQFMLLLSMLDEISLGLALFSGASIYFLITTVLPMISFLEAAIRAAVALIVFKDAGISTPALALASILLWVANIVIPSIVGYYFLLKQNFSFKSIKIKA
jgi:hypothetical protein